jgi:uncharacterized RDD family membrane protein YckC
MNNHVGLINRFAACIYEFLSLIALWLLCTAIFIMFFDSADTALKRLCLQLVLWLTTGAYFIRCWVTTGQTLATQAWKIRLVDQKNQALTISQAVLRYLLATFSLVGFGIGFLWAFVDKERMFLHDRILKTRFIKVGTASNR